MGILIRQPKGQPGLWVTKRDYDVFKDTGRALMPDLVRVESQYVVLEVDDKGRTRPVALCKDNPGKSYRKNHLAAIRKLLPKSRDDISVRLSDLVTLDTISKRTGRNPSTILTRWLYWLDFPEHVMELGHSRIWLWPYVRRSIVNHKLPIVRKGVTRKDGKTVESDSARRKQDTHT